MNKDVIKKGILLLFMVLYAVSPVDLMPGPVDDAIVLVAGIIGQKRLETKDEWK